MRWPYSQKSFLGSSLDVCQISCFYRQRHDSFKNMPLSAALQGINTHARGASLLFGARTLQTSVGSLGGPQTNNLLGVA